MLTPIPNAFPRTRFVAFILNTLAVYVLALHISPWLVGRWYAWVTPTLHIATRTSPGDWLMQHFEIALAIPALLVGYLTVRQKVTLATFAWVVPTLVLIHRLLTFRDSHYSVLGGRTVSPFGYFFDIQRVMPTFLNPVASDPVQVLAQITITAPFYAGVAYSLGALAAKYRIVETLFSHEPSAEEQQVSVAAANDRD